MNATSDEPSDKDDIFLLTSDFARNELDAPGQQRLLAALRDPQRGSAAAQEAWRAMAMHTDLRSSLGQDVFRDAIITRLQEDRSNGFMQAVLQRLGWSSRGLDPVALPPLPRPHRAWLWLAIIVILLLGVTVAIALRWQLLGEAKAQVVELSGSVRFEGQVLRQAQDLHPGILSIERNSRLRLALRDGHILIQGPAQATLGHSGIGLSVGRAQLHSGSQSLYLGSPHGAVHLDAHSSASAEIIDGRLAIAISDGSGAQITSADGSSRTLSNGQASYADQTFAWHQHTHPNTTLWQLPEESASPLWRAQGIWQPGTRPRLSLLDEHGSSLAQIDGQQLSVGQQHYQLHGPPRGQRTLALRHSQGRSWLRIDGWDEDIPLAESVHTVIASENGRLKHLQWWNGPQHIPAVD